MVELAPLRRTRPATQSRSDLRLVKTAELGRLHQLLMVVVAMEGVQLLINLWRHRP